MSLPTRAKRRVALIGSFEAAYRTSRIALAFMDRPSVYAFTARDPAWYERPIFGRTVRPLVFGEYAAWAIRAISHADVVVFAAGFYSSPLYLTLLNVAQSLRKRIVFDFYVSLFDSHVRERQRFDPDSIRARLLVDTDRLAMLSASPVIFLSNAERTYYSKMLSVDAAAIDSRIVPLVTPERPSALTPFASGAASVPTVAWWGRLGNPLHGIEHVLSALQLASEKLDGSLEVALFPSGTAAEIEDFKQLASHIPNVQIDLASTFENGRLLDFLYSHTDLALGAFGGTEKARIVPVNKIIDAMSLGIPSVTGDSAALREQLAPGTLTFVPHQDPHLLATAIAAVLSDKHELQIQSERVRQQWHAVYSPRAFEKTFLQALEVSDR